MVEHSSPSRSPWAQATMLATARECYNQALAAL
jgi:hypothetical protein